MRTLQQAFAVVALMALLAGGASPAYAGVVFELETTYHTGAKAQVERGKMYVLKPNMKMGIMTGVASSEGDVADEMIYRGDLRQIIIVQHDEKAYMVVDPKTMGKLGGQMSDAGAQMQEAMKDLEKQMAELSPEEREMMEKMLKDKMPPGAALGSERPEPEYRRTKSKETMSGFPCVRYDVYLGEEKTQELWVTGWDNIEGSKELMTVFEDMSGFYAEMMKSLDKTAGGFISADRDPMGDLANIDGFPVVTRSFQGGELESETVLKSVTKRKLDPADFDVPKGYKLRKMGSE